jgi:hypothetical protein
MTPYSKPLFTGLRNCLQGGRFEKAASREWWKFERESSRMGVYQDITSNLSPVGRRKKTLSWPRNVS